MTSFETMCRDDGSGAIYGKVSLVLASEIVHDDDDDDDAKEQSDEDEMEQSASVDEMIGGSAEAVILFSGLARAATILSLHVLTISATSSRSRSGGIFLLSSGSCTI